MTRVARLAGAVGWPSAAQEHYRAAGLWKGQTLSAWFSERAELLAEQTALIDGARRVSYRELLQGVARLAGGLAASGVRELDRVIVQLPNSLELVETLLAVSWLGAVPVLALPAHRRAEIAAFAQHAGASALVVAARHAGQDMLEVAPAVQSEHPQIERVVVHGAPDVVVPAPLHALATLRAYESVVANPTPEAHDVALLQLSGGSTGIPKLIARTHDDYLYSVRESARVCELSTATRFSAALPMTHNFTLSSPGFLGVFHAGGSVVACAHPHPEVAPRLLVEERITLVASVPSLARAWLEAKPRYLGAITLPSLTLQVGGARLDVQLARDLLSRFGGRLQQVFGMAEGLVNYTRLSDSEDVVCETQGRPLSEHDELRIASLEDPAGPAVAPGELGELQTRGPYTICGYFDNRAADARAFTLDGFYRTGDVVRLTSVSRVEAPAVAALQAMQNDLASAVDLRRGPLVASTLFRLGPELHYWLLRAHHIALDGYAFSLVQRRVAALYAEQLRGAKAPPACAVSIADWVTADQNYRRSPAFVRDREFGWLGWKARRRAAAWHRHSPCRV